MRSLNDPVMRKLILLLSPFATLATIAITVAVLMLWPMIYYEVWGFRNVPETVCVDQPMDIDVEYAIYNPPHTAVNEISLVSYWTNEITGEQTLAAAGEIEDTDGDGQLDPVPRGIYPASLIRFAPSEPGPYTLSTEAEVYVKRLDYVPNVQKAEYATNIIEVLPADAPNCRGSDDERDNNSRGTTYSGGARLSDDWLVAIKEAW